jgi:hypothetical protein
MVNKAGAHLLCTSFCLSEFKLAKASSALGYLLSPVNIRS